jgi:hypothetical protein
VRSGTWQAVVCTALIAVAMVVFSLPAEAASDPDGDASSTDFNSNDTASVCVRAGGFKRCRNVDN